MSVLDPRKLRWIFVAVVVLGSIIYISTQLADYNYADNQWHPAWSYYVYLSGIVLFFIGIGLGLLTSFAWMRTKDKPQDRT